MSHTLSTRLSIDDIDDEWERLSARASAAPWHGPLWYRAWGEAFAGSGLEFLTVERNGLLTGVLPLHIVGGEVRAAANSETPDFAPVVEGNSDAHSLAEALFARGRRVNLAPLPLENPASTALYSAARAAGYAVMDRVLGGSPFVAVTTWDEYVGTLNTKMVREIGRRRRRLEEDGRLELAFTVTEDDVSPILEECFQLEARGWKGRAGTAMASSAATKAFYLRLCQLAAHRGWLVLATLRLDGKLIAFDISLEVDDVHHLLKTSFDEDLAKFGPGSLLRFLMLQRVFDSGMKSYEFLGRDDPWKEQWTSEIRPLSHLRAFPPNVRGRMEHGFFTVGRAVKDVIARTR